MDGPKQPPPASQPVLQPWKKDEVTAMVEFIKKATRDGIDLTFLRACARYCSESGSTRSIFTVERKLIQILNAQSIHTNLLDEDTLFYIQGVFGIKTEELLTDTVLMLFLRLAGKDYACSFEDEDLVKEWFRWYPTSLFLYSSIDLSEHLLERFRTLKPTIEKDKSLTQTERVQIMYLMRIPVKEDWARSIPNVMINKHNVITKWRKIHKWSREDNAKLVVFINFSVEDRSDTSLAALSKRFREYYDDFPDEESRIQRNALDMLSDQTWHTEFFNFETFVFVVNALEIEPRKLLEDSSFRPFLIDLAETAEKKIPVKELAVMFIEKHPVFFLLLASSMRPLDYFIEKFESMKSRIENDAGLTQSQRIKIMFMMNIPVKENWTKNHGGLVFDEHFAIESHSEVDRRAPVEGNLFSLEEKMWFRAFADYVISESRSFSETFYLMVCCRKFLKKSPTTLEFWVVFKEISKQLQPKFFKNTMLDYFANLSFTKKLSAKNLLDEMENMAMFQVDEDDVITFYRSEGRCIGKRNSYRPVQMKITAATVTAFLLEVSKHAYEPWNTQDILSVFMFWRKMAHEVPLFLQTLRELVATIVAGEYRQITTFDTIRVLYILEENAHPIVLASARQYGHIDIDNAGVVRSKFITRDGYYLEDIDTKKPIIEENIQDPSTPSTSETRPVRKERASFERLVKLVTPVYGSESTRRNQCSIVADPREQDTMDFSSEIAQESMSPSFSDTNETETELEETTSESLSIHNQAAVVAPPSSSPSAPSSPTSVPPVDVSETNDTEDDDFSFDVAQLDIPDKEQLKKQGDDKEPPNKKFKLEKPNCGTREQSAKRLWRTIVFGIECLNSSFLTDVGTMFKKAFDKSKPTNRVQLVDLKRVVDMLVEKCIEDSSNSTELNDTNSMPLSDILNFSFSVAMETNPSIIGEPEGLLRRSRKDLDLNKKRVPKTTVVDGFRWFHDKLVNDCQTV